MSFKFSPGKKVRLTAEARFKQREERKTDAEKVWVEMAATRTAEIAKTDRLRVLRLAKEETDREAAALLAISKTAMKVATPRRTKPSGRAPGAHGAKARFR